MQTVTLTVKGMTCMGCVRSVTNVLEALPGVRDVEVTLESGLVRLAHDPAQTSLDDLKTAINDAGYEVGP